MVTKAISPQTAAGANRGPRLVSGRRHAELQRPQNVGLEAFSADKAPQLRALARLLPTWPGNRRRVRMLATLLDACAEISALELNLSCPNVKTGGMLLVWIRSCAYHHETVRRHAKRESASCPPSGRYRGRGAAAEAGGADA